MSAVQTKEVRRRQLANLAHLDRWPALVAELRVPMEAGVDARAAPVQAIVLRWQQMFRDSYCGDDAALGARVRDAFIQEPDLRLGVGIDEASLTYLQRARAVAHHFAGRERRPEAKRAACGDAARGAPVARIAPGA